ncbi:MAG: UDP-3-O-acyl-N-acetylglucosamine deacetylase [Armatimonadota bacterium]|nr:UDP-3-O-acyl-N-acetylglucosamine deacetylase [Armatimonadota bacterium]MDR7535644.1 UDP-3-O-acyl-N-acetylglucosamine deacetylase [Armatimonadota bacterium]
MTASAAQRTIARPVTVTGTGLHTGEPVTARLLPAPEHHGVTFRRADVPGASVIPACLGEVVATDRGVVLGRRVPVATVEHLLSAARGLGIDNLAVEVEGEELPCGDGSAQIFVDALGRAGTVAQAAARSPIALTAPVWVGGGASVIVALPAPRLQVTYIATANGVALAPQMAEFDADRDDYATTIAPARTWGLLAEAEQLRARGLARGASLATTLVIGVEGFINEPRFPNEMARHKILDALGDLSLLGRPLHAQILAVRAGHGLHIALARAIARQTGAGDGSQDT